MIPQYPINSSDRRVVVTWRLQLSNNRKDDGAQCADIAVASYGALGHVPLESISNNFLADRTIGRAFGTLYRLSVVCRL